MDYIGMKKALLRVKRMCEQKGDCIARKECPFMGKLYCRIADPSEWDIDDWKDGVENAKEANHQTR